MRCKRETKKKAILGQAMDPKKRTAWHVRIVDGGAGAKVPR